MSIPIGIILAVSMIVLCITSVQPQQSNITEGNPPVTEKNSEDN